MNSWCRWSLHVAADDGAVEDVEGGEQRGCAVAFVVVGHRSGAARLHRQTRLGTVERLDLALLMAIGRRNAQRIPRQGQPLQGRALLRGDLPHRRKIRGDDSGRQRAHPGRLRGSRCRHSRRTHLDQRNAEGDCSREREDRDSPARTSHGGSPRARASNRGRRVLPGHLRHERRGCAQAAGDAGTAEVIVPQDIMRKSRV